MITGQPPFEGKDISSTLQNIHYGNLEYPTNVSGILLDLVKRTINWNTKTRYNVDQILRHEFYAGLDASSVIAPSLTEVSFSQHRDEFENHSPIQQMYDHLAKTPSEKYNIYSQKSRPLNARVDSHLIQSALSPKFNACITLNGRQNMRSNKSQINLHSQAANAAVSGNNGKTEREDASGQAANNPSRKLIRSYSRQDYICTQPDSTQKQAHPPHNLKTHRPCISVLKNDQRHTGKTNKFTSHTTNTKMDKRSVNQDNIPKFNLNQNYEEPNMEIINKDILATLGLDDNTENQMNQSNLDPAYTSNQNTYSSIQNPHKPTPGDEINLMCYSPLQITKTNCHNLSRASTANNPLLNFTKPNNKDLLLLKSMPDLHLGALHPPSPPPPPSL